MSLQGPCPLNPQFQPPSHLETQGWPKAHLPLAPPVLQVAVSGPRPHPLDLGLCSACPPEGPAARLRWSTLGQVGLSVTSEETCSTLWANNPFHSPSLKRQGHSGQPQEEITWPSSLAWVHSLGGEDSLQKGMATYSCSCLENSIDRGAWRATVPRVAKSWTLKGLSTQTGSTYVRDTSYKEKENSLRNTNSASVVWLSWAWFVFTTPVLLFVFPWHSYAAMFFFIYSLDIKYTLSIRCSLVTRLKLRWE